MDHASVTNIYTLISISFLNIMKSFTDSIFKLNIHRRLLQAILSIELVHIFCGISEGLVVEARG